MRRVIVEYKKLNKEILDLLVQKFPYGYDSEDIIAFKNAQNETIEAVEVRTEDTIYLVKVSKRLLDTMELFQEDDSDYDDSDENETEAPEVADESSDESEDY